MVELIFLVIFCIINLLSGMYFRYEMPDLLDNTFESYDYEESIFLGDFFDFDIVGILLILLSITAVGFSVVWVAYMLVMAIKEKEAEYSLVSVLWPIILVIIHFVILCFLGIKYLPILLACGLLGFWGRLLRKKSMALAMQVFGKMCNVFIYLIKDNEG